MMVLGQAAVAHLVESDDAFQGEGCQGRSSGEATERVKTTARTERQSRAQHKEEELQYRPSSPETERPGHLVRLRLGTLKALQHLLSLALFDRVRVLHDLEWRDEPAWQRLDAELHAGLANLPERSTAALEESSIRPRGTLFHREPISSRTERAAWGARKREALDLADLIFLDPEKWSRRRNREARHVVRDQAPSETWPGGCFHYLFGSKHAA